MKMDLDTALRAGGLQALMVVVLALLLSLALPKGFFEDWGWITGPLAWLGCAAIVSRRLTLPRFQTVIGAAVAGVPMLIALAIGAHWLGVLVGLAAFGAWCGTLEPSRPRRTRIERRRHDVT